jgi:putative DNA primase/helicase
MSVEFAAFCRAHGLIVDSIDAGRWVRVPTTDHPRKRNGAYKFMGDVGWVQNHAVDMEVSTWRTDKPMQESQTRRIVEQASAFDQRMRDGWKRAAIAAQSMLAVAKLAEHNYLHFKGFGDTNGLVMPDGALMVPMRHWRTNAMVGSQVIRWDDQARRYDKKMLPGMRAKGAVLRLGSAQAPRLWLVEGYATGLSVEAALRLLRLRDAVLVCFSAGNLIHVAAQLGGGAMVFADNDASGAGERAAQSTGFPYCMSDRIGEDANDMHQRVGVFTLANLMMEATRQEMAGVT